MGTFSDWADLMHAQDANNDWGQLSCGCHPNCGTGMAVMIDKETKEAVPVTAFLHGDQLARRKRHRKGKRRFAREVYDWSWDGAVPDEELIDPFQSPTHFKLLDLLRKFDKKLST